MSVSYTCINLKVNKSAVIEPGSFYSVIMRNMHEMRKIIYFV